MRTPRRGAVGATGYARPAAYEARYELATMAGRQVGGMLAVTGIHAEPRPGMSEDDQRAGAGTGLAPAGLFLVERRLPKIGERQLALLQAALTSAAGRFTARGDGVAYLGSFFLAGSGRLLSLFTAENADAVRAVNEAALIPFASIEPAVELSGPGQP